LPETAALLGSAVPGRKQCSKRLCAGLVTPFAQQPGIKRTPLQKVEFPEGDNTITAIAEVPTGAAGRHTHPGIETGYVLEGEVALLIEVSRRKP
jgi:quercetin dioxygenase-like cupin family protein